MPPSLTTRRGPVAVLAAALPLLTGCYRWVGIGDSVLFHTGGEVRNTLGPDGLVDVSIGRGPTSNPFGDTTVLEAVADRAPLVDPGGWQLVQDDGSHATPASFRAMVADVNALVPDDVCIAWVAPYNVWEQRRDAALAAALRSAGARHPCNVVVPWDEVAAADPTAYLTDGLHPTIAGEVAFAEAVADAIAAGAAG